MNKYLKQFDEILTKMNFINDYEIGDKIGKYEDTIIVNKNSYLQGVVRYYNNESKEKSVEYLQELFEEYSVFLKEIISELQIVSDKQLKLIAYNCEEMNDVFKVFLDDLSKTYNNEYEPLKEFIQQVYNSFRIFSFRLFMLDK